MFFKYYYDSNNSLINKPFNTSNNHFSSENRHSKLRNEDLEHKHVGYEPADLTVHPPPPRTAEGGFIFFVWVSSVPKEKILKGKPVLFGIIEVKRPKNVVFQHIHSNPILIILTFLYNNE